MGGGSPLPFLGGLGGKSHPGNNNNNNNPVVLEYFPSTVLLLLLIVIILIIVCACATPADPCISCVGFYLVGRKNVKGLSGLQGLSGFGLNMEALGEHFGLIFGVLGGHLGSCLVPWGVCGLQGEPRDAQRRSRRAPGGA